MTFCLLSCNLNPFWKGVFFKREDSASIVAYIPAYMYEHKITLSKNLFEGLLNP